MSWQHGRARRRLEVQDFNSLYVNPLHPRRSTKFHIRKSRYDFLVESLSPCRLLCDEGQGVMQCSIHFIVLRDSVAEHVDYNVSVSTSDTASTNQAVLTV